MDSYKYAWLAGAIDVRGTVTAFKYGNDHIRPRLSITFAEESEAHAAKKRFGCGIVTPESGSNRWAWRINVAKDVATLLQAAMPHLQSPLQRKRARLVLQLCALVKSKGGSHRTLPQEVRQQRAQLYEQIILV